MEKMKNDCRLLNIGDEWFLVIPLNKELKTCTSNGSCALDPGVRKFHTIYSPDKVTMIKTRKSLKRKLYIKLDKLRSSRAKNLISDTKYRTQYRQIQKRLNNLTDDMHYRVINYLLSNYRVIHIPKFQSRNMCKILRNSTNRELFSLKHYLFRTRLIHCAGHGFEINVCNESYTSKTCTRCGTLNNTIGKSEMFKCNNCTLSIDRDINGSRNIYIKHEH